MARCRIQGYLYSPIGAALTVGKLYIQPTQDFVSDGVKVTPVQLTVDLSTTSGFVDVELYSTTNASPGGVAYRVWFDPDPTDASKPVHAKAGYFENFWSVPTSASVPLGSFTSAERGTTYANYMPLTGTLSSLPEFLLLGSSPANTNKGFQANQVSANKPSIRYNAATSKWQISHDGVVFADALNSLDALGASTPFGGDVTGTYSNLQIAAGAVGATELANSGVTAGTYGSASIVPVITVDAKGRITSVTTQTVSGGGGGGAATGTAGGDLSGSYPNPNVIALRGKSLSSVLPSVAGQIYRWDQAANEWAPSLDGTALDVSASKLTLGTVPLARISGLTNTQIASGAAIAWSKIDKTGSALADFPGSVSAGQLPATVVLTDGSRSFAPSATTGTGLLVSSTALTSGILLQGMVPNSGFTGSLLDFRTQAGTVRFVVDSTGKIATGTIDYANVVNKSVVNADVSASADIAWTKISKSGSNLTDLATRAITDTTGNLPYARLTLTGTLLNADIATNAAIAYSKLSLTGAIVNADIASAAAIDWTKISKTGSSLADLATRDIAATTGTLPVARGGTGGTATPTLNGIAYGTGSAIAYTVAGTVGQVFRTGPTGAPEWADPAATTGHALLSGGHTDVTAAGVTRGALIVGQGATPTWSRLSLGASGTFLQSNGTDVVWSSTIGNVGITFLDGTVAAPSIRFASATTSGFHYQSSGGVFRATVNGADVFQFQTPTVNTAAVVALSANGQVSLRLGDGSTTALTSSQSSATLRFNGSGVAWGDMTYFPNGTTATGGHWRFNRSADSVEGVLSGTLGAGIFVAKPTGSASTPLYTFWNDATTGFSSLSSGTLSLITSGTQRMILNSTGVGINTTPVGAFDIAATAVGNSVGSNIAQRFRWTSGNSIYLDLMSRRALAGTTWDTLSLRLQQTVDVTPMSYIEFNPGTTGTQALAFGYNTTEHMRITSDGYFGIGVVPGSTTYKVDINGAVIRVASGSTGTGYVQFGQSSTAINNWTVGSTGDSNFKIYNGNYGSATERLNLTSGGTLTLTSGNLVALSVSANPATGRAICFNLGDQFTINSRIIQHYGLTFGASTDYAVGLSGWGGLDFYTSGNHRLAILSNGLTGIGTAAPESRLHVVGAGSAPSLSYNAAGIAQISNGLTQLSVSIDSSSPFGASLQVRHATLNGYTYPLNLQPLGGNVGIGLQDPGQKLVVFGGFHVTGSAALGTTGPPGLISYEYPSIRHYIGDGTGYSFKLSSRASSTTTDRLTVKDSGDAHLGNGTPVVGDTATIFAGKHKTFDSSISIATGTATTMATFPNTNSAWLITTTISANDGPGNYMNVGLLRVANGSAIYTAIVSSGFLSVSMSGLSVQLTQNTGGTQTGQISALRLH